MTTVIEAGAREGARSYHAQAQRRQGAWARLRAEAAAQAGRWFLWAPVAFGGGCATYFALLQEPSTWMAAPGLVAVGAAIAAARAGLRTPMVLALLAAFFAAGVAAAQLRTSSVAAPVLTVRSAPTVVEGWVVDVASPGAGGGRLIIAPTRIGGVDTRAMPARVRVTVNGQDVFGPGAPVRMLAILNPPPGPASPGAYDFARDAWFERIGAVGFAVRAPQVASLPEPRDVRLRVLLKVNAFRWALSRRIVERMGPWSGGVAAAMTTGHEAWLTRETLDAMRDSGLAHVLSISGLHMAVVGGFAFFAARLLIAAWPWLALRINGKKAAALCGLAAVGGYLVLSGSPAPAERAAITASVAFLAVLLDRRAITLRALAIAALLVLAWQPEAVVQPGFQMSFAATTALIALAERWPKQTREINTPWPITAVQRAGAWIGLSAAVSFVAGLATGAFAVQHFNRMASYGLVANLVTAPLSSLVIMPFLATGAALELFGLGGPFLGVADGGIRAMLAVAHLVSSWPGGVQTIPSAPAAALPVAFLGLLFVCLWEGRLRWLGLPFAAAVLVWPRPETPVAWLADGGANAAVVRDGRAAFMRSGQAFAAELWARRRGLVAEEDPEAFDCDRRRCVAGAARPAIAASFTRKAPDAKTWGLLCAGADFVLVRSAGPRPACGRATVLGPEAFARGGSAEIYKEGGGWRIVWAAERRGRRPWTSGSGA
ncbi:MAG TPA: ComEC/Rec2 family competence protein [Caulobacteraceae bacterium]